MSRTPIIRGAVIAAIGIAAFLCLAPTVARGLSPPHDASNGIGCEDCHSGHGGGMFDGLIPRGAEQEALCKSCHNPTGQASTMVDVGNHEVDAGTLTIDCGSCHETHGPYQTTDPHTGQTADNLKLVRGDTAKYLPAAQEPAIFQQRPDHFSFDTGPFTGICQSCHTSTNYHANDGTDPHHNLGSVCTTCHLHENGFAPGGCTGCHDQAQGPRRQVSAAGGDFERASHHVRGTVEDGDCITCHYSYGGQHMQMSCGNASCHEANSIHRIIHTVDSGAGSQLMLTAAGYEGSYQKPDFTPELETVSGHIGSQQLAVTFKQGQDGIGIYTREDLSGALAPDDFWLFDVDGDNPKAVTGVVHTAGAYAATLILDTPLTAADLGRDILAVRPRTIWDWYAGGYQNAATGTIGAQAVSAGPWPAVVTGPAPVGLVKTAYAGSQIRVFFNEAVYGTGAGGAIQSSDLVLSNCAGRAIVSIDHLAGDSTATLTLDSPLTLGDLGACSVAAAAASVSDAYGNHAGSTSVALSLSDECPIGATSFQFDEAAGSPYAFDEQYRYVGTVSNPATSLPGDGLFHGDENQATPTVIDFDNSLACLKEANTITVEALLRTDDVDLDYDGPSDLTPGDQDATRNATFSRVFERKRTIKITIMRADYAGDNVDSRAGRARVEVKYFVDAASRHSCPHPQWPDDTYQGNDSRWHQVSTDIDAYPLLSDHWYKIRVVFNSAKTRIPIDIWVDDLGTDDPAVNPDVGEWWPGFINIAMPDPQDSSSCRWGALPGDVIALEDQASHVGAPPGHTSAYVMKGQIDWISWKPEADYTGVDDGPHY